MKAKLDENLPLRIATPLRELGHDGAITNQQPMRKISQVNHLFTVS